MTKMELAEKHENSFDELRNNRVLLIFCRTTKRLFYQSQ